MKFHLLLSAILIILFTQNCATLVSRSVYPFTIETNPKGANIKVVNSRAVEVFNGESPANLALRSGAGYFKKEKYMVTISMDGYEDQSFPITASVDSWFFGNIAFGGVIGFLIIDPMTGSMYKLKSDYVKIKLKSENYSTDKSELIIYDFASLPEEWKENLERIDLESVKK